ncbi:MAG: putative glycoside hydrolase [Candidatus Peribacteraceae bacterium]|nr:putative glycoside hydrolase [Candidatus Peribacteraceae bacterium]
MFLTEKEHMLFPSCTSKKLQCVVMTAFAVLCVFLLSVQYRALAGYVQFRIPTAMPTQTEEQRQALLDVHRFLEQHRGTANKVDAYLEDMSVAHAAASYERGINKVGVYLTADSVANASFYSQTLDRLQQAGASAFVVDVKGSYVYFPTTSSLAEEMKLVRPLYELPEIVSIAKQKGIYVIARLIAASDPVFGLRNPDVRIRHPQTGVAVGSKWVDLGHPTTIEYNKQVIRDIVTAGVDELNIDYIRYPTEYAQWQIGLTGQQKADRIEKFVQMARQTIDEYNPSVLLGLSTYAILGWNYPVNLEPLGQDVIRFAPLVDIISPMAYPSTFAAGAYYNPATHPRSRMYYLVYQTLKGYAELLGEEHAAKLRPWIQGYYITNKDLRDEIDAVYDAGACGFTVWSAGNHYDILYKVFPEVNIPERCLIP